MSSTSSPRSATRPNGWPSLRTSCFNRGERGIQETPGVAVLLEHGPVRRDLDLYPAPVGIRAVGLLSLRDVLLSAADAGDQPARHPRLGALVPGPRSRHRAPARPAIRLLPRLGGGPAGGLSPHLAHRAWVHGRPEVRRPLAATAGRGRARALHAAQRGCRLLRLGLRCGKADPRPPRPAPPRP